jgi:hypothetical protein
LTLGGFKLWVDWIQRVQPHRVHGWEETHGGHDGDAKHAAGLQHAARV